MSVQPVLSVNGDAKYSGHGLNGFLPISHGQVTSGNSLSGTSSFARFDPSFIKSQSSTQIIFCMAVSRSNVQPCSGRKGLPHR